MTRLAGNVALILLAAAILLTPQTVFGLRGGGCGCTFGEHECGLNGYECFCCREFNDTRADGPVVSKCRMGAKFFSMAHPPAVIVRIDLAEHVFIGRHDAGPSMAHAAEAYSGLPEKPPRA